MSTPAQHIFPPKPKGKIYTPLTARIPDAIEDRKEPEDILEERRDGDESGKTPETGGRNRLQRKAKVEE